MLDRIYSELDKKLIEFPLQEDDRLLTFAFLAMSYGFPVNVLQYDENLRMIAHRVLTLRGLFAMIDFEADFQQVSYLEKVTGQYVTISFLQYKSQLKLETIDTNFVIQKKYPGEVISKIISRLDNSGVFEKFSSTFTQFKQHLGVAVLVTVVIFCLEGFSYKNFKIRLV